jgi:uncharacterized protein YbjT (DUF2867 family)
MASVRVLLAGATGLVGGEALRLFLADPAVEQVIAPVRRPLPDATSPKLVAPVIDFERLERHPELFAVSHVACALGTTMRQAGSRDAFRRVDHDYPLALARLALAGGARHFLLVSAIGADPGSRFFYNRVKGEVEAALRALPFRSLTILRPALLLGPRREFRLGERIAQALGWLTPARYRPIAARAVAAGVVRAALEDRPGIRVLESAELQRWGDARPAR